MGTGEPRPQRKGWPCPLYKKDNEYEILFYDEKWFLYGCNCNILYEAEGTSDSPPKKGWKLHGRCPTIEREDDILPGQCTACYGTGCIQTEGIQGPDQPCPKCSGSGSQLRVTGAGIEGANGLYTKDEDEHDNIIYKNENKYEIFFLDFYAEWWLADKNCDVFYKAKGTRDYWGEWEANKSLPTIRFSSEPEEAEKDIPNHLTVSDAGIPEANGLYMKDKNGNYENKDF